MKCRICASECPPGAKLCRDCAAARKRAFAATVTQPLLAAAGASSVGQARFEPRPKQRISRNPSAAATAARSEAVIAAAALDAKVAPRRFGVRWLWLGIAIAIAIVYVLIRMLAGTHGESSDALPPSDGAREVTAPAAPAPAVVPLPAPPASVRPADAGAAAEGAATKNAAPKARLRKPAPKLELPGAAEPPAAPKAEPAPAPRTPPPQVAAPPRDPWQAMNEGLTRCAREDWAGRATCEQRLRLQYCPEHWGLVPQCPIGPTDHGS